MLKGGLALIWELDMNLGPTLIKSYLQQEFQKPSTLSWLGVPKLVHKLMQGVFHAHILMGHVTTKSL